MTPPVRPSTVSSSFVNKADTKDRHVVCLHGLARSKLSMAPLARMLASDRFIIHNVGYGSRHASLSTLIDQVEIVLRRRIPEGSEVYFVGHSLGGLILRFVSVRTQTVFAWKRGVLLGSPNQGAQIARFIRRVPLLSHFFGPVLQDIAEARWSTEEPVCELAVIAGGTGTSVGFLPLLAGDNDGLVTVSETNLPHAKLQRVIPVPHPILMLHPRSIRMIRQFLKTGDL